MHANKLQPLSAPEQNNLIFNHPFVYKRFASRNGLMRLALANHPIFFAGKQLV